MSLVQLRQAQKMEAVGQLTGGVAHDLNNILTVIMGTIEILAESVADRPELVAITSLINEAVTRGSDLTERLLAFARKQPLQPRNLALNARDAMPDGGTLIIETSNVVVDETYADMSGDVAAGSYGMVAVSDSGHGIPADILNHVFEPFFTTKDVDKGSGLGLSMVYGFVKQSNGHIKIYSQEGHGTTVRIYLPQAISAAPPAELVTTSNFVGGDETILVVEDDNLVRTFVLGQIKSFGYAALAAVNAAEAMAVINGPQKIDLLFTDMIMPGSMNGRRLADAALQRRPALKILFTSGYSNEVIIHHGHLDAGVLLLAKPYGKADLARMLRTALAA
ncbi:ATP-binding protein [Bradyrhizobium sp.]|uniref:ATP-binding protein n=1 Tax=Bradyrhizobium sp. TaxID=376 RepID=UPI003BB137E4